MRRLLVGLTVAFSGSAQAIELSVNAGLLEVVLVPEQTHAGFLLSVGFGFSAR